LFLSTVLISFASSKTLQFVYNMPDGNNLLFSAYRPASERNVCVQCQNFSYNGGTFEIIIVYTQEGKQYRHSKIVTIQPQQFSTRTGFVGCDNALYGFKLENHSDQIDAIIVKFIQASN